MIVDIHVDPPRHRPSSLSLNTTGDICYRAIIAGDCPLSHDYPNEPITRDEDAQLAWIRARLKAQTYRSQSAREAAEADYGNESYWDYLDQHALELTAKLGNPKYLTRSLSEALAGNEGL